LNGTGAAPVRAGGRIEALQVHAKGRIALRDRAF
jgi:hypothetical protein